MHFLSAGTSAFLSPFVMFAQLFVFSPHVSSYVDTLSTLPILSNCHLAYSLCQVCNFSSAESTPFLVCAFVCVCGVYSLSVSPCLPPHPLLKALQLSIEKKQHENKAKNFFNAECALQK